MKRIRMIMMQTETKKRPNDIFDCAQYDSDPTVFDDMEATQENMEKAAEWLATKKNTAVYMQGFSNGYYLVTAYAVEHYTADEDGEFVDGSDFDVAEEENSDN